MFASLDTSSSEHVGRGGSGQLNCVHLLHLCSCIINRSLAQSMLAEVACNSLH